MKTVLNILWECRYIIIWVIIAVIAGVTMGKQWVQAKAYSLMLLAKKLAKDEVLTTGAEQEEWVVNALYILLKKLKIPFVTKEGLRPVVQKLYVKAMDLYDDGQLNNSYKL